MQPAGFAETHRPAQDRRARQMHFAGFEHDCFIERFMFPAIAFTEKYPQQNRFMWYLHEKTLIGGEVSGKFHLGKLLTHIPARPPPDKKLPKRGYSPRHRAIRHLASGSAFAN